MKLFQKYILTQFINLFTKIEYILIFKEEFNNEKE